MRRLVENISKKLSYLLLAVCCLWLFTACGAKNMSGGYIGEAKAKLKPSGYSSTDGLTDSNRDVLAVVTQDGDKVRLKLSNTFLLNNCELEAKITKNSAYIKDGAICDVNIAGTSGTVNIVDGGISVGDYGDADVLIEIAGFVGSRQNGDYFTLNFRGKSKK